MNQPKDHVDGGFKFLWNPVFAKATNETLRRAQEFVDSECIRQMKRYTPYRTGFLSNNAPKLGTKIGSGLIVYNAPYARYQYYGEVYGPNIPIYKDGELMGWRSPPKKSPTGRELEYSTAKHPDAQKLWFEKMKEVKGEAIRRGAEKIAGGG